MPAFFMNDILKKDTLFGKEKAIAITNEIINAVESGEVKAIDAIVLLKTYSKAIDSAEAILKPQILSEIQKYGKDGATLLGCHISLMEAGTRYDYANTNDQELLELMTELSKISEKVKERQEFLKKLPASGLEILQNGDEVAKIYPPAKSSTSTFKFVFK